MVKLLIHLLVFLTQKPLTLKKRDRRRGDFPIGSSLPRHSAKERTRYTEKNQKRNKRQKPRVDCKLAQKKNIYIYIYIYI